MSSGNRLVETELRAPVSREGHPIRAAALPLAKLRHSLNDAIGLAIAEERVHGQAQYPRTEEVGVGTTGGTEFCEGFLPVQRNRVMHERRNVQFGKVCPQLVALRRRDDKQVVVARTGLGL
jgi:hypothetical protein